MSARGFIAEQDVMVMPVLREVVNHVDSEIVLIEQRAEKDNFAMVVPCARQCPQRQQFWIGRAKPAGCRASTLSMARVSQA